MMEPIDTRPIIVIFGGTGQLGTALQHALAPAARLVVPNSREVSFEDPAAVARFVAATNATAVLNAAAFTGVDAAETDRDRARQINAETPGVIAVACDDIGARLVHVSSDYVFDGSGRVPYHTDAPTRPVNVYGETKLEGERRIVDALPSAVIVRTSWLHSSTGTNFVRTATAMLSRGSSMRVVDDQVGTPTLASSVAEVIARVLTRPSVRGVLHATDTGVATWFDVACCVRDTIQRFGQSDVSAEVIPISSAEFGSPATRPLVSILDTHQTRHVLDWTPPHWRSGVVQTTRHWMTAVGL